MLVAFLYMDVVVVVVVVLGASFCFSCWKIGKNNNNQNNNIFLDNHPTKKHIYM
jgi:hypothetical protein